MKLVVRIVSFILMFYSLQSSANNRNQFDYFGFTANLPSYDLDFTPSATAEELSPLKEQVGSEKVGARVFYGYQFNRYLAAEVGVNYNGENNFSLYTESTNSQNKVVKTTVHSGSFNSYGGDVRVVGTYPITSNFYLKASIGALAWSSELDTVIEENETIFAVDTSDSGVSLITGLGMAYGIKKVVAVSLDIEKTEIAGIDTTNIGLSFTYRL